MGRPTPPNFVMPSNPSRRDGSGVPSFGDGLCISAPIRAHPRSSALKILIHSLSGSIESGGGQTLILTRMEEDGRGLARMG